MQLRIDPAREQLEGWLTRGGETRRIFAHKPDSIREILGWRYVTVLQEVVLGVVQACSPVWKETLDLAGILARVEVLEAEGWMLHAHRPVDIDYAAHGRAVSQSHRKSA